MHSGEAKLGSSLEVESCGNRFCKDMVFVLKNLEVSKIIFKILVADQKYGCLTAYLWIGFCI